MQSAVAQLVGDERRSLLSPKRQRTENPCVGSSILSSTTKKIANNQENGLLAIFALWGISPAGGGLRGWKFDGKTRFLRIKVKPRVKPKLAMTAGINIETCVKIDPELYSGLRLCVNNSFTIYLFYEN